MRKMCGGWMLKKMVIELDVAGFASWVEQHDSGNHTITSKLHELLLYHHQHCFCRLKRVDSGMTASWWWWWWWWRRGWWWSVSGWTRNIPTQKSEQPLLELARDEVFFPPQDTILLLNTCQKDLIQRSEIFTRVSHVQSHMHKNCYEELLTHIVSWECSGLTRYNIKTFTTILKFPKTHSTAGLLQRQNFAYRNRELQKNIL